MKKFITSVAVMIMAATLAQGQNDTTKVTSNNIKFEREGYISKTGEDKTSYIVTIDGKCYPTNKTSADRYALIRRHGGVPCVVRITNKSKKERIVVL